MFERYCFVLLLLLVAFSGEMDRVELGRRNIFLYTLPANLDNALEKYICL